MAFENELSMLLQSDVSNAAVDQLVSKTRLWLLNNWAHFTGGGVVLLIEEAFKFFDRERASRWFFNATLVTYLAFQIVQLINSGFDGLVILDTLLDLALPTLGWLLMLGIMASLEIRPSNQGPHS